jgi:hypothetical protein
MFRHYSVSRAQAEYAIPAQIGGFTDFLCFAASRDQRRQALRADTMETLARYRINWTRLASDPQPLLYLELGSRSGSM